MSTYTDLHNKIKENLTVGYSPEDRITTQKVRFYNEGNEYWGTFKGTFNAEQVDLDGGTLKNVKIIGATLSDISWPGGVDFDAFGALLQNVSAEVDGINDVKIPYIHQRINEEMSARVESDGVLRALIFSTDARLSAFSAKIQEDLRRELSALKFDITWQEKQLSTNIIYQATWLSVALDTKIDDVSAYFDKELYNISSALSAQDYAISAELHDKIDAIYRKLTLDDAYLSSELSTTQINLANEIANRIRSDLALNADINSVSAISDARDRILQNNIDQLNADSMLSIDILRDETTKNIEIERHYEYKNKATQLKDLGSYPFKLDDFAVNRFVFPDIDGQVYLDYYGKKFLASAQHDRTDTIYPLRVTPYKSNEAGILSAFDVNNTYVFTETTQTIPIIKTGYTLTLGYNGSTNPVDKLELSNYNMLLAPIAENYHGVYTPIGSRIGHITGALPTGTTSNIISGFFTVEGVYDDEDAYNAFSHFRDIEFNNSDLSSYGPDSRNTGFIYKGNNQLDLRKYDDPIHYVMLSDECPGHVVKTFGRIYETIGDQKSVVSSAIDGITSIKVWLDDYNSFQPYTLKLENNFEEVLDSHYETPEHDIAIISLKAEVNNTDGTAIFTVGQKSTLWKYNFSGKDQEGNLKNLGYIVPEAYNRYVGPFDNDFDTISAYISEVVYFDTMKHKLGDDPVILKKSLNPSEPYIWYGFVEDDSGNVLEVKYIGTDAELRLRLTVGDESRPEIGQIIAQKYKVDLSTENARPAEGYGSQLIIYKTRPIAVGLTETFDQIERNYKEYPLQINSIVEDTERQTYTLKFDTSSNDKFKAVIPPQIELGQNKDVLREFVLDVTIVSKDPNDTTFRKFVLVDDKTGEEIELINTTQNDDYIYINPNRRALYAVREVYPGQFAILDYNDEEDNHWIDVLMQKSNNLSTEIQLLSAALSSDIDNLSIILQNQIISNDNDISYLSGTIDTLSANLCVDIDTLSTRLSTDIDTLSARLSAEIDTLSTLLCVDINAISANLSIDISSLSANLSTDISSLSANISADVSTLSDDVNYDIDKLSSDLSVLSGHYHTTLSADIQIPYEYTSTTGDTISKPLSVDQLLIVDEVTYERYRLTIRNGALNINKVDRLA